MICTRREKSRDAHNDLAEMLAPLHHAMRHGGLAKRQRLANREAQTARIESVAETRDAARGN